MLFKYNRYCEFLQYENVFIHNDILENKLLGGITMCSKEIANELDEVLGKVFNDEWNNNRDPYYSLCKYTLVELKVTSLQKKNSK